MDISCCSNLKAAPFTGCNEPKLIKSIYVVKASDCVFKDNEFVRIKRKYGKYKREVFKK